MIKLLTQLAVHMLFVGFGVALITDTVFAILGAEASPLVLILAGLLGNTAIIVSVFVRPVDPDRVRRAAEQRGIELS